jgi:hypothetical protein
MRTISALIFCMAVGICPLRATFTPITTPDSNYLASTTKLAITGPDLQPFSSLSGTGVTINFSEMLLSGSVPSTFATWASPPLVEQTNPRVLTSLSVNTLVLTFSAPLRIFGLEIQPDAFAGANVRVQFYAGATLLGEFNRTLSGVSGAELFAARSDLNPFTEVRVSATSSSGAAGFATAQYRIAVSDIPEPSEFLPLLALLTYGFARWRRR